MAVQFWARVASTPSLQRPMNVRSAVQPDDPGLRAQSYSSPSHPQIFTTGTLMVAGRGGAGRGDGARATHRPGRATERRESVTAGS